MGPAGVAEDHRLKGVVVETVQAGSAGAEPEPSVPSFAQTPEAHGTGLVSAKIVETPVLRHVDQVGIAIGPDVAAPIDISTKVLGAAPLDLEWIGLQATINKLAHAAPGRYPYRPRTCNVHSGNEFVRKTVPWRISLEFLPDGNVQSGSGPDPNLAVILSGDAGDVVIQQAAGLREL